MKFNVGGSVLVGFIATLIVLAGLAVFSVSSVQRVLSTTRLLSHSVAVSSNSDLALKSILDMESSERGYVISGDESFLETYRTSQQPVAGYLNKLDSLTAGDARQQERVDTLRQLITKQIAWIKRVVDTRHDSFMSAQSLVSSKEGKITVDRIKDCVKQLQSNEADTFRIRNTITAASLKEMQNFFLILSVTVMLILVILFYLIHRTLTARQHVEEQLQSSAREVSELYNDAPCGYYSVDGSLKFTMMNDTLLQWLGYSKEEVLHKMTFTDMLSPASKKLIAEAMKAGLQRYQQEGTSKDQEFEFLRKDGTSFPIIVNSVVVYDEQHRFVQSRSTVSDNTERKKFNDKMREVNVTLEQQVAERTRELAESQHIYQNIASNIPGSAVLLLDREGRYLLVEGDLLKKLGYDRDVLLHSRISEIASADVYQFYRALMDQAFEGEVISRENKTQSGNDTLMRVAPVRNDNHEIFAVMILIIDITDIKTAEAELEQLNATLEKRVIKRTEQLDRVNKELESFTYSVSHDLRAPLRGIIGHAQILEEDYHEKLDDGGQAALKRISHNATLMGQLIDDLLDFSRMGRKELSSTVIDMNSLVQHVSQDLLAQEKDRKVNFTLSPLPSIKADLSMMRQVWINLISNALKYSRKKDVTVIIVGTYTEGEFQVFYIEDNGEGFDMAYADKLFGVFQRLHKAKDFEGTGVGLALVKTIVARHGGTVMGEGKVKEGAKFYFTLPLNK